MNEEYQHKAVATSGDNNQFILIGGFSIALLAGSFSPLLGLLIGAYALFKTLEGAGKQGKSLVASLEGDCLHALTGDDFIKATKSMGYAKSKEELERALEKDLPLSREAWEFARSLPLPVETRLLTPVPVSVDSKADSKADTKAESQLKKMASKNLSILGLGGSGKGILVSNLMRWGKQANSSLKIMVIDPKADAREAAYWQAADQLEALPVRDLGAEEVISWLDHCLDRYLTWIAQVEKQGGEGLLIIDELLVLGHHCKKLKYNRIGSLILSIASLGDCLGRKIWVLTQTPYVGSVGLDLTSLSQINWITIVREDQNLKSWRQAANLPDFTQESLAGKIARSPVKRAIAIGNEWLSMPRLENYSSLCRDSKSSLISPSKGAEEQIDWQSIKDNPVILKWQKAIKEQGYEKFKSSLCPQSQVYLERIKIFMV
jgi:hypothetical protein